MKRWTIPTYFARGGKQNIPARKSAQNQAFVLEPRGKWKSCLQTERTWVGIPDEMSVYLHLVPDGWNPRGKFIRIKAKQGEMKQLYLQALHK